MRWTAGLFILFATPALAASPQCAMQGPTVIKASAPVAQPACHCPSARRSPNRARPLLFPQTSPDIAFAQHIASAGAQVSDLGTIHGLQAISARSGSQFMIFELSKDGQAGVLRRADRPYRRAAPDGGIRQHHRCRGSPRLPGLFCSQRPAVPGFFMRHLINRA